MRLLLPRTVDEENTSNPICEDFPDSQSIPVSSQVENSSRPKISTIDSFPYRPCEVILSEKEKFHFKKK